MTVISSPLMNPPFIILVYCFIPAFAVTITFFLGYQVKNQASFLQLQHCSWLIKMLAFLSVFLFSCSLFVPSLTVSFTNAPSHSLPWTHYVNFLPHFIGAYLLGSIPFGILFSRFSHLPDPRTVGSGNIGATNVLRTGNKGIAFATLLADGLKGTLAIKIFHYHSSYGLLSPDTFELLLGFFAILGHIFPLWIGFKGGKGVATALGIYGVVFGYIGCVGLLTVWVLCSLIFRYSSLSSLLMIFATVPLGWYYEKNSVIIFMIALLIIFRHKDNLLRLYQGAENKILAFSRKKT